MPLLVHHYHHAEKKEQERHYATLAGQRAAKQYANQDAIAYFSRALELTPESALEARYDILLAREAVNDLRGERDAQAEDLAALSDLASKMEQSQLHATIALRQAKYARRMSDYAKTLSVVQQAIEYATEAQNQAMQAEGYHTWGVTLRQKCNYKEAQQRLQQALALARGHQQKIEANSLQQLGTVNFYQGNYTVASEYYKQALLIHRAVNDRQGEATSLMMLGGVHTHQGEYIIVKKRYKQALTIYERIGYRMGESIILGNLGVNYGDVGDYEVSRDYQQRQFYISADWRR